MIYTSWFVISEAMTILLYKYGYSEAVVFNQSIDLYLIYQTRESQHHQAVALFNLYGQNRKISFVDALSRIIITGDLKNIPAISFDSDFQTLGLTTIS
jgi:predicted nucleic acid-binding protein